MIGFMAGGIIPAFQEMAADLHVSLDTTSYTVSIQVNPSIRNAAVQYLTKYLL